MNGRIMEQTTNLLRSPVPGRTLRVVGPPGGVLGVDGFAHVLARAAIALFLRSVDAVVVIATRDVTVRVAQALEKVEHSPGADVNIPTFLVRSLNAFGYVVFLFSHLEENK